jgi:hypothetical protein
MSRRQATYKITIEVTYDCGTPEVPESAPDPGALLDAVQDDPALPGMLSPYDETVASFDVSVEEKK